MAGGRKVEHMDLKKKAFRLRDLEFLCQIYGSVISEWSENLPKAWRQEFYEVYKATAESKTAHKAMKKTLSLT